MAKDAGWFSDFFVQTGSTYAATVGYLHFLTQQSKILARSNVIVYNDTNDDIVL